MFAFHKENIYFFIGIQSIDISVTQLLFVNDVGMYLKLFDKSKLSSVTFKDQLLPKS